MSDSERRRETGGRLILFVVAIPLFGALTIVLTGQSHLTLAAATTIATPFAAHEVLRLMLGEDRQPLVRGIAIVASTCVPALTYLQITGVIGPQAIIGFVAGSVCLLLAICTIGSTAPAEDPIRTRASALVLVLIYPGLLVSYVVRIASLDHTGQVILSFFILIFGADIGGYLAGRLTRSRSLGLLLSPNKTIAGFVGSLLVALLLGISVTRIFPDALSLSTMAALGLGAAVGMATIVGDLVESAFKRAAAVKNSGRVIPGRGGVMDSIDSILFGAPVFYALVA